MNDTMHRDESAMGHEQDGQPTGPARGPARRTETVRTMQRYVQLPVVNEGPAQERPKTRGECSDGPRPCPWVSCRYHLYLDTKPSGSLSLSVQELERMPETCVLDVADRGGATLEEVGDVLGVTRERIRQIEAGALHRLRRDRGIRTFEDHVLGTEGS